MPRRVPPLTHVRAFEAAARHESFKAAAAELHVTDAAVSQHVKQLEGWLGVTLFRRTRRGVRLTAAGSSYFPDLTAAITLIAEATERLNASQPAGLLNVSVAPSLGTRWLLPRLERFHAARPDIRVCASVAPELSDFTAEDVDVAIRHGDGQWPGVQSCHLKDEHLVPVCAPSLLGGRRRLAVAELLALPALMARTRAREWRVWLESAAREGIAGPAEPASMGTYATLALALDAAIAGAGVTLADRELVAADLAAGRLCIPVAHACIGPHAYYIVHPEPAAADPRVAAFRDWLIAEVARESR